jgi:hypothetical protein
MGHAIGPVALRDKSLPESPTSVMNCSRTSSNLRELSVQRLALRLAGCASVLGLGNGGNCYLLKTSSSKGGGAEEMLSCGDYLLYVLDFIRDDRSKCALCCASKAILAEQRRVRPATSLRPRVSLSALLSARAAGWRMTHCHVDKRSGDWSTRRVLPERDALADLRALSVCGRPDCALLVLSPFTALGMLVELRSLEFEKCAIGDAGLGVLAAAFKTGAMPALTVLDVRHNQIGDAGVVSLAVAILDGWPSWMLTRSLTSPPSGKQQRSAPSSPRPLSKLQTLGLDYNPRVGEPGLQALGRSLAHGALPELRSLYIDNHEHLGLIAACAARSAPIELRYW